MAPPASQLRRGKSRWSVPLRPPSRIGVRVNAGRCLFDLLSAHDLVVDSPPFHAAIHLASEHDVGCLQGGAADAAHYKLVGHANNGASEEGVAYDLETDQGLVNERQ